MARGSFYANFFKLIFHYREHIVLFLPTIAIYLEPYLTIRFTLLTLRHSKSHPCNVGYSWGIIRVGSLLPTRFSFPHAILMRFNPNRIVAN